MLLNANQKRALERALSLAKGKEDAISYLEKIAEHSPAYAERVKQLRERQTYLIQFAELALVADHSTK